MKPEYKKYLMIGSLVIFLLIIGYIIFSRDSTNKQQSNDIEPTEEIIPTVDSTVKVNLKSLRMGEVLLTVSNEPKNTNLIEFELNYSVVNSDVSRGDNDTVDQGVLGKCYKISSNWECGESNPNGGRKIILGTCSSGTCRYHDIVGSIKVILKFTGEYGQKLFEKEYSL